MFVLTFLGDVIVFVAGGALIWFCKPAIQKMVLGANALSAKLHAQADALAPKVTAAVDAIKKV
jgi:hypothetical protein